MANQHPLGSVLAANHQGKHRHTSGTHADSQGAEFRKEGVEGTDAIFTWDAIVELVVFSLCIVSAGSIPTLTDELMTTSDKVVITVLDAP